MDNKLKELPHHCYDLSKLIGKLDLIPVPGTMFDEVCEWLNFASGITKVELITDRYGDDCMFCSSVAEYEDAKSKLWEGIAIELTRFLYIWNTVEMISDGFANKPIRIITKSSIKKKGKVNALCHFIKSNFAMEYLPIHYHELLKNFEKLAKSSQGYKAIFNKFQFNKEWISQAGMGLYTVYKIRNKFAHGNHSLPEPEEWSGTASLDKKIIESSSRLVLLSIQILLISYFKQDSELIEGYWSDIIDLKTVEDEEGNITGLDVKKYLQSMHLLDK